MNKSESFAAFQKRFKPSPVIIGTDEEYNAYDRERMWAVWKSAVAWCRKTHKAELAVLLSERDDNARAAERAMDAVDKLEQEIAKETP